MWPCVTGDTSPLTRHSLNDTHCSAESSISTMSSPIAVGKSHSPMQGRKDCTNCSLPYCRSFSSFALSYGTCGLIENTARWLDALLRRDVFLYVGQKEPFCEDIQTAALDKTVKMMYGSAELTVNALQKHSFQI